MSINSIFDVFLQKRLAHNVKQSTISTYVSIYNSHIALQLGTKEIEDITEETISNFMQRLLKSNLSRKYIKSIETLLFSLLSYAKKLYRDNTELQFIEKTKYKVAKSNINLFTKKEQIKIEEYVLANITPFNIGVLLSLYLGLRIGELSALMINDISFDNCTVSIDKTLQRIKNLDSNAKTKTKIVISNPKTENAKRVLPIPQFLIPILKKLCTEVNQNSYFLTLSFKFLEPRAIEYQFKKLLKLCEVSYRNFHVLRHTFANNLLDKNAEIKAVSELLGHSNITITLNEYIHPSFKKKLGYIEMLNQDFIDCHNFDNYTI